MRRWLSVLALLWLTACNQNVFVTGEVVIPYEGKTRFPVWVAPSAEWELYTDAKWFTLSQTAGIGPAQIEIAVRPEMLPDQASVDARIEFYGPTTSDINVRYEMVQLSGQILAPTPLRTSPPVVAPAVPLQTETASTASNEVLVRYRSGYKVPNGARLLSRDPGSGVVKLYSPNPQELLAQLKADPTVLWAEPNGRVYAQSDNPLEPTDEFYERQWYLRSTGSRFSYLSNYTRPVTVAVIDTGVRYDHPDLAGKLISPQQGALDVIGGDPDPTDPNDFDNPSAGSHGTHVTGIIVARSGDNSLPASCFDQGQELCSKSGVVGAAYNAPIKVLPIRVLDSNGSGSFEDVATAIRYAAGYPVRVAGVDYQNPNPVQIINLSLGTSTYSSVMCDAVTAAVSRGVLVVAAAGNNGAGLYFYPGSCTGALAVAATDLNYGGTPKPTWYSQHHDRVAMAAPGGDNNQSSNGLTCRRSDNGSTFPCPDGILSTSWDYENKRPNYAFRMGTSQAAPQAAAALALLLSSQRAATPAQAWDLLRQQLTDLGAMGKDDYYGYGFLNLPGAFGWKLPPGGYQVRVVSVNRTLALSPTGVFSTYIPAGNQLLQICRDDSQNALCDPNELYKGLSILVPSQPSHDLGVLTPPVGN